MSSTVSINASNTSIWLNPGQSYALTGSNDVFYCGSGSNLTLVGGNDTLVFGDNVHATVYGTNEVVSEAGAGDVLSIANSGPGSDLIGLNGTGDYVGLVGGSNFTVFNDNAGDTVAMLGNTAATVTGSGGGIYLSGSGDNVTASNETIGTAANDQNESVTGTGDTIFESAHNTFNVSGGFDTVDITGASDYAALLGGSGDVVYNDNANDNVNLTANTSATITGTGGDIGLLGSGDTITASNETINTVANDQNESVTGTGDTIFESANNAFNVSGGYDTIHLASYSDYLGLLGGSGYSVTGTGDTINTRANTSFNLAGGNDTVGLGGTGDYLGLLGGSGYSVTGTGDTINTRANTSFNLAGGNDIVGLGGTGDYLGLLGGTGYVVYNDNTSDQVELAGSVTATINGSGGLIGVNGIDAVYNAVLGRDMTAAELTAAEALLATGTSLNGLQAQLANSTEAQSDMASTYAAVSGFGPIQAQLDAQPQSTFQLLNVGDVQDQVTSVPTQTEFNAFADAMSTSYGAPVELFSVDPNSGAQTELADTSVTNLLAELPVLETQANGANLGLQLADGTQVQFASTARTATFLYSLAVQQMQATSFVTDNYNLDMQWLNTVDQPLLDKAVYWSERATAEAAVYPERTIEDNVQASLALQIAAQAPSSRQDLAVTIHNGATGNPTQITVYAAGDGSTLHDVAPSVFGYVESAISTVLNIGALVSDNAYLYFAAAAIDAAEGGQDLANGQDIQGILSLAQAVGAGIGGATGTPTSTPPVTTQIINAAVQGVGGVYGVVQSAQTGNAAGILAGALEAAAAAAAGIGMYDGGQTQAMLNAISAALGTAGVATTMASDFASGNLGQGLVDSLNLYLPAVAQAYASYQDTLTFLDNGAWDTAGAAISDPGWANNDQAGSGLNSGQLALANIASASTAPINGATLFAPTGLWFSNGDGVEPMSVPINDLLLPNFYHPGAQYLTADPGYFGVAGDGNPTTIIGPNGTQTDANQLAALVQSAGWQQGQPIQLFACFTGAPNPFGGPDIAQQLANILNTEVIAPSTFGWVYPNGSFVIASANNPSLNYNSPLADLQASGPNLSAQGNWNLFVPSSSSLINDLLNFPVGSGGIIKPPSGR